MDWWLNRCSRSPRYAMKQAAMHKWAMFWGGYFAHFALTLLLKFPKSHPDRSLSFPWLKSLVLALAARNNRMKKGRGKESLSAAKHINLQIYLVVIIPEGETYSILHHQRNCPHLFRVGNRRSAACASSSTEGTNLFYCPPPVWALCAHLDYQSYLWWFFSFMEMLVSSFQVQAVSSPLGSSPGQSQKLWQKPSPCHVPYSGVCCTMPCVLGSMQDALQLSGLLAVFITKVFHYRLHLAGDVEVLGRQSPWLLQFGEKWPFLGHEPLPDFKQGHECNWCTCREWAVGHGCWEQDEGFWPLGLVLMRGLDCSGEIKEWPDRREACRTGPSSHVSISKSCRRRQRSRRWCTVPCRMHCPVPPQDSLHSSSFQHVSLLQGASLPGCLLWCREQTFRDWRNMRYGTEIWHKEGSVGERRKDKALDWDQALTHLHVLRSGLRSDPGATEGLEGAGCPSAPGGSLALEKGEVQPVSCSKLALELGSCCFTSAAQECWSHLLSSWSQEHAWFVLWFPKLWLSQPSMLLQCYLKRGPRPTDTPYPAELS